MAGSHCKDHIACSGVGIDHTGHVIIKADRYKVNPHLRKTDQENVISDGKQEEGQPVLTPDICCQRLPAVCLGTNSFSMGLNPDKSYPTILTLIV